MPRAPVAIRPATPGDRPEWLRMRGALWPDAREDHAGEIDAWLRAAARDAAVFVAERNDGRLGGLLETRLRDSAEGCTSSPVAYVEAWWVDADLRRHGVGAALMRAAEDWARARGLAELASDCDVANQASLRAHQALGFAEVARVICLRKGL
jgi:aminoglycoside 6'-N-acetyltransferase I